DRAGSGHRRRHARETPVVVVVAVHRPMVGGDVVVEFVERGPRRRLRREGRIGTGLRVVVVLILERSEEPELVAHDRTRDLPRRVAPLIAMVRKAAARAAVDALAFLR